MSSTDRNWRNEEANRNRLSTHAYQAYRTLNEDLYCACRDEKKKRKRRRRRGRRRGRREEIGKEGKKEGPIESGGKIQCVQWLAASFTRDLFTRQYLWHTRLLRYHDLKQTFLSSVLLQIVRLLHRSPLYSLATYSCKRVFSNRERERERERERGRGRVHPGEVTLNRSSRTSSLDFQASWGGRHGELFSGCGRIDAPATCYYTFDQVYCRTDNAPRLYTFAWIFPGHVSCNLQTGFLSFSSSSSSVVCPFREEFRTTELKPNVNLEGKIPQSWDNFTISWIN